MPRVLDAPVRARARTVAPPFLPTETMPGVDSRELTVLGFDFGTARTGVAIANTVSGCARPLTVIEAVERAALWTAIGALVDEWQPDLFVVGIPRHPDGAPHEMTARCERFARQLEGRHGARVARVDERYSSAVEGVEDDADAAALILQQWLDESTAAPERRDA